MCFGGSAPTPPPPVPPPPQLPDTNVQQAGANARARAGAAMGPMSTILNMGGAQGLQAPPSTTKSSLGG